jgi:prepilin-type N-terminal cleavage/methylation domain-containing protein
MSMQQPRSMQGFTLVELVVVITLLGILAAFAVPRFLKLNEKAEYAAVAAFVGALKSARMLSFADFSSRGALPSGYVGPQDFTLFNLTRCDDGDPTERDPSTPGGHYIGLSTLRTSVFQDPTQMACSGNTIEFVTKSGRTVTITGNGTVSWNAAPIY